MWITTKKRHFFLFVPKKKYWLYKLVLKIDEIGANKEAIFKAKKLWITLST